jgi:hypothetical protein
MYKICVFYPLTLEYDEVSKEQYKKALFASGAGKIGNYDCCVFETLGVGEFRPLEGSTPSLGEKGKVESVKEYKLEMVCDDSKITEVIKTLVKEHPYETPAYEVYKLENF